MQMTPTTQEIILRTDKLDCKRLKDFCIAKKAIRGVKKHLIVQEKIFATLHLTENEHLDSLKKLNYKF